MKTKLDKWERTLLALYAGAVSGIGFNDVTAKYMGIEESDFAWTLYIMQMRGVIEGCSFQPPRPGDRKQNIQVNRSDLMLTPKGFEQVEAITDAKSDEERLEEIYMLLRISGSVEMVRIINSRITEISILRNE